MRKLCTVALAVVFVLPAAVALAGPGHGGGGSHGGGSHGGGSHGSCGSHHGSSHHGGSHHGGSHHWGGTHGGVIVGEPYGGVWGVYGDPYGPDLVPWYAEDPFDWATVDIDVAPGDAGVYLEDRYIGTARDFGRAFDYLYLRPGTYKLDIRLDGYEAVSRTVEAKSGAHVEIGESLSRIPGASRPSVDRDAAPEGGVQRYWGKRRGKLVALGSRRPSDEHSNDIDAEADGDESPAHESGSQQSREPAGLLFYIEPPDAAVYLDGHFIGTAEEVDSHRDALFLPAGKHTVFVLRPGFKTRELQIDVAPRELRRIEVQLEK